MSLHREDWAGIFTKIGENVKAHPLPYLLVAILIAGIVLGRCSAN